MMDSPKQQNRREFLGSATVITSFTLAGCSSPARQATHEIREREHSGRANSTPGKARYLGTVDLKNPTWLSHRLAQEPPRTKTGNGRNARKYADLTEFLPDGPVDLAGIENLIHSSENFFLRTETPDLLDLEKLTHIEIDGLVDKPRALSIEGIRALEREIGVAMLECAGNDRTSRFRLMSCAHWSGVPCREVFEMGRIKPEASHVLVFGFDRRKENERPGLFAVKSSPGASWIFSLDDLKRQRAFFATRMNGERLTSDHGFPLRLVVPGWYGCASIKWVSEITFFRADSQTRATAQMREFADRTHQVGTPRFYRDYVAPEVDVAAAPIRVEQWLEPDGAPSYRLIGLLWGGIEVVDPDLRITLREAGSNRVMVDREPVTRKERKNPLSWQLWSFRWKPEWSGPCKVDLSVNSACVKTRRLAVHHYRQVIEV